MENKSVINLIPEGASRCVWMDAGVTEFKLCDQEFHCETCSFDKNFIQQNTETIILHDQKETQFFSKSDTMTSDDLFSIILKKRLDQMRNANIPNDRNYNHGQFWIQQIKTGNYKIGVNHILTNLFNPILSIVTSKVPSVIHKHDPFCWIILPGGAITLRSPIEATITQFNPALQLKPDLLRTAPFNDGWIIKLKAKSKVLADFTSSDDSKLLTNKALSNVEHIFKREFHHLQPSVGSTLFDGGVSFDTIENIFGPTVYREIVNRITHLPS